MLPKPLRFLFAAASVLLAFATMAAALGSTCSTPITQGTAGPNDPFWMQNIQHQGLAAYNSNPGSYQVFRNVKDFGAKGDVSDSCILLLERVLMIIMNSGCH